MVALIAVGISRKFGLPEIETTFWQPCVRAAGVLMKKAPIYEQGDFAG
jgi:hypothetical protein